MDRSVPRRTESIVVLADSSDRLADETSSSYRIRFAERFRNVTGLRVSKATVPQQANNIVHGRNQLRLCVASTSDTTRTFRETAPLLTYLATRGIVATVQSTNQSGARLVVRSDVDRLWFASSSSSRPRLLAAATEQTWDVKLPVTLRAPTTVEEYGLALDAAYHRVQESILTTLVDTFESLAAPANPLLPEAFFRADEEEAGSAGWSWVDVDSHGGWSIMLSSSGERVRVFLMSSSGLLQQLGAGAALVEMSSTSIPNRGRVYSAPFRRVDMHPVRYVDVAVKNLPRRALAVSSNGRSRNTLARVHFSNQSLVEQTAQDLRYATYTADCSTPIRDFDPVSMDFLEIELRDNFGNLYDVRADHALELLLTVASDPAVDDPKTAAAAAAAARRGRRDRSGHARGDARGGARGHARGHARKRVQQGWVGNVGWVQNVVGWRGVLAGAGASVAALWLVRRWWRRRAQAV